MHRPELPDHAADHPRPNRPTHPHTAVRGAQKCAPRSSTSCTLLVVVEAAGSVAGITSGTVQLRSAVEESSEMFCIMLIGSVLATGFAAPLAINAVGRSSPSASADRFLAWEVGHLHAKSAFDPAPLQSSLSLPPPAPQRPSEAMPLSLAGNGVRCVHPIKAISDPRYKSSTVPSVRLQGHQTPHVPHRSQSTPRELAKKSNTFCMTLTPSWASDRLTLTPSSPPGEYALHATLGYACISRSGCFDRVTVPGSFWSVELFCSLRPVLTSDADERRCSSRRLRSLRNSDAHERRCPSRRPRRVHARSSFVEDTAAIRDRLSCPATSVHCPKLLEKQPQPYRTMRAGMQRHRNLLVQLTLENQNLWSCFKESAQKYAIDQTRASVVENGDWIEVARYRIET